MDKNKYCALRPTACAHKKYFNLLFSSTVTLEMGSYLNNSPLASSGLSSFSKLQKENYFTDVTLAYEEKLIEAHKMILSACSIF